MARCSSTLLFLCACGLASVLVSPAFISAPAGVASKVSSKVRAVGSGAALPQSPTNGAASGVLAGGLLLAGAAIALRASVARRAMEPVPAIPRPEDLLESDKFPKFGGSTGGYMSRATRERHAITWTAKEESMFEMPTAGFAIMNKGENLCYFRKKEQCLALGKQLRKMKIENYKIYRIKKDGTVLFMHPADGVFPEKVNKGRVQVNGRPFSIGQNAKPGTLSWTKYGMKVYEADALSTMFVKARVRAFMDEENLFAIPAVDGWVKREEAEEFSKKMAEKLESL